MLKLAAQDVRRASEEDFRSRRSQLMATLKEKSETERVCSETPCVRECACVFHFVCMCVHVYACTRVSV